MDEESRVAPLRAGGRRIGPVRTAVGERGVALVTIWADEERDLFHAAGQWLAGRPEAVLLGVNFIGSCLTSHEHDPPAGQPSERLDLVVDLSAERHQP